MQYSCIQFLYPNTGKLQRWPLPLTELETDLLLPPSMMCNNLEARICFAVKGIGNAYLPDFAIRE
jgi:hypothetical protein